MEINDTVLIVGQNVVNLIFLKNNLAFFYNVYIVHIVVYWFSIFLVVITHYVKIVI